MVVPCYYPVRNLPEARPCHGREEIARFHAEYGGAWDRWEIAIERLIAVGDDRVFVHAIVHGVGRESGLRLEGDLYHCAWLRQRRIFRWEDHLTLGGCPARAWSQRRNPPRRRAFGVGNVAGERGDRVFAPAEHEPPPPVHGVRRKRTTALLLRAAL
jgi:hypothetical protein